MDHYEFKSVLNSLLGYIGGIVLQNNTVTLYCNGIAQFSKMKNSQTSSNTSNSEQTKNKQNKDTELKRDQ